MRAKQVFKIATAAAIVVSCMVGCGDIPGEGMNELNIQQEDNQLEQWKEELAQSTQADGIYSGAVRGIEIQKNGKDVFAASYEPREYKDTFAYWDISIPYHSLVAVNTEELYKLFDMVTMATWVEDPNMNLEKVGFAESGTAIFIAYDAEQKQGELGGIEPTESKIILIGREDGAGNYYAAIDGSDKVYTIDKTVIDTLLDINPYQYILKIPVLVSQKAVAEVKILGTKKEHVLKREDDKWLVDGEELGDQEFQDYYASLMDIPITGECSDDIEPDDEREPVLTVQYDREDATASDIEVKYYPCNETQMSVCVNGQERFLVDNDSVEQLREKLDNFS